MSPRRRLVTVLAAALAAGSGPGCGDEPAAPEPGRAARDPIVFVHGWHGSPANWGTMVARFEADGWAPERLRAWAYDSRRGNGAAAAGLRDEVEAVLAATGARRVDVVTHSMGALPSRYYAKHLGGDAKVDQWVSLGGPNHGTDFAELCGDVSCGEMRIGSAFLDDLNAGDETPGAPSYATWWSPCDDIINPDSSVALSGARNTRTACIGHGALITDSTVYRQVRDFVSS